MSKSTLGQVETPELPTAVDAGDPLGASTLDEVLDRLAAPAPGPAGASAAALTAAMAGSLVVMVARGAPTWPEGDAVARRTSQLRASLVKLAEDDARAVGRLLEASRNLTGPDRAEELVSALVEASKPPVAIAVAAAEIVELATEAATNGKRAMKPDAAAAVMLARAATGAATLVVEANLSAIPGDRAAAERSLLMQQAGAAATRAEVAPPAASR